MTNSVNRILANNANLVRTASLAASVQRASSDLRLVSVVRQGGGSVALSGAYTGAADTTVDVEILSGSGSALRPSLPRLSGVGSGALTVLSVDAAAVPERITVSLVAAGSAASYAELPFFGATLKAKVAGTAGNALTLTVERRLTLTPTEWSTLEEIAAGAASHEGAQWDWGSVPTGDSQIPATAPRLALDGSPQVYRHWRAWEGGRWVYYLDPPPAEKIPAGTRVSAVTGDYRLTLTDGTTTEVIDAITVYAALLQWRARSALIEVVGTVAEDRAPGGMAATDIPLRTDAYAMPVQAQLGGPYGVPRLDALSVDVTAPTEIITVERQASGVWSVAGSVSGDLPDAKTGVAYAPEAAPLSFTIPAAEVPPGSESGIDATPIYVPRAAGEITPPLCLYPKLGASASAKSVTFVYTLRPQAGGCACANLPAPIIRDSCLGLSGGEEDMDLPAAVAERVSDVYAWRETFVRANTRWVDADPGGEVWEGADPGTPGQYRVRISALITCLYDGLPSVQGTAQGVLSYIFATQAEAQASANSISGVVMSVPPGGTILGLSVNWVALPCTSASIGVNPYTWGATVETQVAPVAPVQGTLVVRPAVAAHWEGATAELAVMDNVLDILLPCLVQVYAEPDALTDWDALWLEAKAEIESRLLTTSGEDIGTNTSGAWYRRYAAACDNLRILAGIYPSFDLASSGTGGCWQDDPTATYWWVDAAGEYLPVFTGKGYASCKRVNGAVIQTFEFGIGVVTACEASLKEGDKFTVRLFGANFDGYEVGDLYRVPLVAAAPAHWAGGAAGNATQTWALGGSVSGAWPDWSYDPATPSDYAAGLVGLRLAPGGIPFEVGDAFTFDLEGGRMRWRRAAGAWTEADLYGAAVDIGDGMTLTATGGVAPSFVAGDAWSWSALATFGPGQARQPRAGAGWSWDDEDAVLDIDLGSAQPLGAVLLALHSMPEAATITLGGGVSAATEWTLELTWSAGPILAILDPQVSARYLRLTLGECGAGATLGWLWAGVPWAPTAGVSGMTHIRQYGLLRGGGLNPTALYRGRGTGGRWNWDLGAGGALLPDDLSGLLALLDHVAEQGLEWVCLVPDLRTPATAALAQIDADEVTLTEHLGFELGGLPLTSVELPFRAVLA